MKDSTSEIVGRILDIETELTDEMQSQVELAEFLHERGHSGTPLTFAEVSCALQLAGYDPRVAIEAAMSEPAKKAREEVEAMTGNTRKRGPGRPRKQAGLPAGAAGIT